MNKQFLSLIAILLFTMAFAQTQGINYKALITENGNVLNTQNVNVRFTLIQNGNNNVYQETQSVSTDTNGIISLQIGEGNTVSGDFNAIDWSAGEYFLKVEIDTGNGYTDFGTTAFKYVPYAKYAETAGNVFSGDFNDLSNIPAGLSDGDDVNDADHDTTNELQTLSFDNGTRQLTISNGNTVTIPAGSASGGDGWGTQVAATDSSINGDGTSANPLGVNPNASIFNNWDKNAADDFSGSYVDLTDIPADIADGDDVNDADHDPSNELQTISKSGSTVTLSNGGGSFTDADTHLSDSDIAAMGYIKNANDADHDATNELQTLSVSGNQLTISNGNTVTLPTGSGGDQWGSQVVESDTSLTGDGTSANPLAVDTNSSAFNGWDKDASDDFSGNYYDLSNKPVTFYKSGTTYEPNDIADDIYTIGKVTFGGDYLVDSRIFVDGNNYSSDISTSSVLSDNNDHFSITSNITGNGNGYIKGFSFTSNNTGNGIHQGMSIQLQGNSTAIKNGLYISIPNGSNNLYGSKIYILSDGNGKHIGTTNQMDGSGSGVHKAIENLIFGTGTGDKYGTFNEIDDNAGGKHYAVYGKATKNAPDVYAGYFLGNVAIGTNDTDKYILPASKGTAGQVMKTDVNGQVSWQDDFSGDYNDLTNKPVTFYKSGTTEVPTNINDDIYTFGNLTIGNMNVSGSNSTLYLNKTVSNNDDIMLEFDEISGNGNGNIVLKQLFSHSDGTGAREGQNIYLQGSSDAYKRGYYVSIPSGGGDHLGSYMFLSSDGDGMHIGTTNQMEGAGNGEHYGVKNSLYGTGNGDKYGSYNKIDTNAGGRHYAVYGEATKNAPDVYAGYFVGNVKVTQGKLLGTDSGNSDMKAYVYGFITSSAAIQTNKSSTGFTASKIATGQFRITFDDTSIDNNYILTANVDAMSPRILTVDYRSGYCDIYIFDLSGNQVDDDFHFVVYRK